jgi:TPR repeat protein
MFEDAAGAGNVRAYSLLADSYFHGRGVPVDFQTALSLYGHAAERGDLDAQCQFGHMLSAGIAIERDYPEALRWLGAAAEQNHPGACYNLGVMYEQGRGVAADPLRAAEFFGRAADRGEARAAYSLAVLILRGVEGLPHALSDAFVLMRNAAASGDSNALFYMGYFHETGEIAPRDVFEAVANYFSAAKQGHLQAMASVVRVVGEVIEASNNGDPQAAMLLGDLLYAGCGIVADQPKAVELYSVAAEAGVPDAQARMGNVCRLGICVRPDPDDAIRWYLLAAAGGIVVAMEQLAEIYDQAGDVVPAFAYGSMAVASGSLNMGDFMERVRSRLTAEQVLAAEAMARDLADSCSRSD